MPYISPLLFIERCIRRMCRMCITFCVNVRSVYFYFNEIFLPIKHTEHSAYKNMNEYVYYLASV